MCLPSHLPHYHVYHFLLTLSDIAGGEGLEHGQSSDNGVDEKSFESQKSQLADADLLSHEFTHSWNGKYRRPYNLYQPDFATMQQGSLLWVYEGMTQYLGNVLAARSGLKSQAAYRDMLAASAAQLDYKSGREWRPTEDTAIAASILRSDGPAWSNWRRGQDYYQEGELFWLDADTKIRELSNDQKSLTNFLHLFLGKGGNTGPLIVTYNRDELVRDLNNVVQYDWATSFHDRIDLINPHADFDGITRGGYKIVYQDHPTESFETLMKAYGRRAGTGPHVWYSLGLQLGADGTIHDVRWGNLADKARLAPGQKIIAAKGIVYKTDNEDHHSNTLVNAIEAAKTSKDPNPLPGAIGGVHHASQHRLPRGHALSRHGPRRWHQRLHRRDHCPARQARNWICRGSNPVATPSGSLLCRETLMVCGHESALLNGKYQRHVC